AGRGSPHGGVFLDIASRRTPEDIRRRLPSMYHQFKELAGVDITAEPMEVGPTCHYIMGGVRVDADSTAATVPGLFAAGEVAGGMHGSNRLGGNSLSDLLVFGRRAGEGAVAFAEGRTGSVSLDEAEVAAIIDAAVAPLQREGGENPYAVHQDLQRTMQSLVGIIRTGSELEEALGAIEELEERASAVSVGGGIAYNPGWNMATDLPSMLTVSRAVAQGAINRKESRGGHTRDDFPTPDAEMGKVNFVQRIEQPDAAGVLGTPSVRTIGVGPEPLPVMPDELAALFEEAH
ncbi:MAG: FAD-binding protein, partial [Actinomycetota bacterium]|nr:FAD-binding protein [Actinomycetota bacterium]